MTTQTQKLAILFADISKSSIIYEQLGDRAAQEAVGRILDRLSACTTRYGGSVVKTVGDAVIATFPDAHNAIESAKSMQQAMEDEFSNLGGGIPPIHIHIGLHFGEVVVENNDIFGDAVNTTSRVVDYANPRQIVATRAVIDNLPDDSGHFTKYLAKITAKNIAGELELFEIIYEDQNTTMVIDCRKISKAVCGSLFLVRGTQIIVVDRQRPMISIGREEFNDISIPYSWISRTHAYIENRSGVFLLKDKSTNGTFVYPEDAEPVYLNKGEHPLAGRGIIVFGRSKENQMDGEVADTLEYDIR